MTMQSERAVFFCHTERGVTSNGDVWLAGELAVLTGSLLSNLCNKRKKKGGK